MAETKEKNLPKDLEDITTEDTSSYISTESVKNNNLQRGLQARHIQMIALGGTIG